jgi:DUF917 family protein
MRITERDIDAMALGAFVLGSGGAGDPYLTTEMLRNQLSGGRHLDIVALDELPPDAEVAPLAMVGSPHALSEKLLSTSDIRTLFFAEGLRDRAPDAVMPYELAGLNALYPLAAAAELGVPVLDADFTGRGFSSLDTTMLGISGAQLAEHIICDSRGRTVTVRTTGVISLESLIRPMAETMGWLVGISTASLRRDFLAAHSLAGTVSDCLAIGRMFGTFAESSIESVESTLEAAGGRLLGSGRVVERVSAPERLGPRASVAIEPDQPGAALLRIEQRNEFHLVVRDGEILASVPDIITVVDRDTWTPLSSEEVSTQRDVHVIALPAHERWFEPTALAAVDPRAFGYGVDYVRIAGLPSRSTS